MTSNIGARDIIKAAPLGFTPHDDSSETLPYDEMKKIVLDKLKKTFRPEFLNRIDEVVIFNSLGKEEIREIVRLQLGMLQDRLDEKKITLVLSDEAINYLAEKGFDSVYGARPIKRTVQRLVENPLALQVLEGEFQEGDKVKVDLKEEQLIFKKVELAKTAKN